MYGNLFGQRGVRRICIALKQKNKICFSVEAPCFRECTSSRYLMIIALYAFFYITSRLLFTIARPNISVLCYIHLFLCTYTSPTLHFYIWLSSKFACITLYSCWDLLCNVSLCSYIQSMEISASQHSPPVYPHPDRSHLTIIQTRLYFRCVYHGLHPHIWDTCEIRAKRRKAVLK